MFLLLRYDVNRNMNTRLIYNIIFHVLHIYSHNLMVRCQIESLNQTAEEHLAMTASMKASSIISKSHLPEVDQYCGC